MGQDQLKWLRSGLYRLLFGTSLCTAVISAEKMLNQSKSLQRVDSSAGRLENVYKLVTGAAAELSCASVLWQWCWQLMLLGTVREFLNCCKSLGVALDNNSAAVQEAGSHIHYELPEISRDDLIINRRLGSGSFGAVFAASWKGTPVAVKCIEFDLGCSAEKLLQDMENEAKMMAVKNHPNVVRFLAVCREMPAIIMELCLAGSIDKQIVRHRSFSSLQAAESIQQQTLLITPLRLVKLLHDVAAAMGFLHTVSNQGARSAVLHCDLRAPNLLLAGSCQRPEDWSVRVADFGLAQWVGSDGCVHTQRVTNHLWVAPEVLDSNSNSTHYKVSRAADVYAFGAVMWELLTGKLPHVDSNMAPRDKCMLARGNPCATKGGLQWPSSKHLLPGLNCRMILQLQPLFQSCVDLNVNQRPSFEDIQQQLASILHEERAGLAAAAEAERRAASATVQEQLGTGQHACYPSLGPSSQESMEPAGAAAASLQASFHQTTPFALGINQHLLANGSMECSPFHTSSTSVLTAAASLTA